MACRQRQEHQIGVSGDRPLRALQVWHQHRGEQPRKALCIVEHFGRIGELRHQLRRDERADLDLALPGAVGAPQPFTLAFGRDDGGDALQPVAQAHFADDRGSWNRCHG
jgi:hypothetical protein